MEDIEKVERIYDIWARRNPKFEKGIEDSVLRVITDYGVGASENMGNKGKVTGAGYEGYIMAFFIGLYCDSRKKIRGIFKTLGQPIQYWGNLDSKKDRTAYPKLREYIFTALVAKTDINWIEVDKGNIKSSKAVDMLMETMEEYANYGFHVIEDKLKEDPGAFFNNTAFLNLFLNITKKVDDEGINPEELSSVNDIEETPESLD